MSFTDTDVGNQVSFIFANKSEDDIILRKELDEMAAKHDQLKVSAFSAQMKDLKK